MEGAFSLPESQSYLVEGKEFHEAHHESGKAHAFFSGGSCARRWHARGQYGLAASIAEDPDLESAQQSWWAPFPREALLISGRDSFLHRWAIFSTLVCVLSREQLGRVRFWLDQRTNAEEYSVSFTTRRGLSLRAFQMLNSVH